MHRALPLCALLALACDKHEEPQKPASAGRTEIFGSAPIAPADAGKDAPSATPPACLGADAGEDCPMLRLMTVELTHAFAQKNAAAVAGMLERLSRQAPAEYTNWASISRDGAEAAKQGEWSAVKAACRGCHDQYQQKYASAHRAEALP